jgi:hypothetical protein
MNFKDAVQSAKNLAKEGSKYMKEVVVGIAKRQLRLFDL